MTQHLDLEAIMARYRVAQEDASHVVIIDNLIASSDDVPALVKAVERYQRLTRDAIAAAIHDGPAAQEQYDQEGIARHPFTECPYRAQYRRDADAVLALIEEPETDGE